jgi:hypothetical protein
MITYFKRPVPPSANDLPGWLSTELGNVQRAIASVVLTGAGSPEGAVIASVGQLYTRTDGGAGTTLYVKESGVGNTGWIAK